MGTCQATVWRRRSKGVMAKGTEVHTTVVDVCGRPAEKNLCPRHEAQAARTAAKLAARRGA